MRRPLTIIAIVILFLAACSPITGEDTSTPQPLNPITPTDTATIAPTSLPSQTPDATEIAYKTNYPLTFEARWTGVAATLENRRVACDDGFNLERAEWVLDDTDGEWTVFTCSPISENWTERYTAVKHHEGTQTWRVSHKNFNWSQRPDALLKVIHWDENSEVVYLRSLTYPFGSGFNARGFLTTERNIYELDLNNGDFKPLFPELVNDGGYSVYYAYAFSANLGYLVFNDPNDGTVIHIQDLRSEKNTTIRIGEEYSQIGQFVWTPDNQQIIFAAALDGWLEGEAGISLLSYSMEDEYLSTLLYNDLNNYIPHKHWGEADFWIAANILNLSSIDIKEDKFIANGWHIDIDTGDIITLPTPTPQP